MKISVCIPLYNCEQYIERTIDSLLQQTYKDFELLIADNCSTDKSVELISKYTDPRIHLIRNKENVGMVNNWNILLDEAKGEYIHFLCADDCLRNDCLEKEIEFLIKNPSVVLLSNATQIINQHEKKLFVRRYYRRQRVFNGKKFAKHSFHRKNLYGEPSNVIFKRDIVLDNKIIFNNTLRYSPDWEFWIKVSLHGDIGFLPDILADYRISTTSETNSLFKNKKLIKEDEERLIKSLKDIPGLKINKFDICFHKCSMGFRTFEKKVFLFFNRLFERKRKNESN